VVALLEKQMPKLTITIDPLERRGFEYHVGCTFSFFSANSREELGRGGRYLIPGAEPQEEAVGFSLLVNTLQRNITAPEETPRLYLPSGTSLKEAESWQKKGYATVLGLDAAGNDKKEAVRQGCGFYLAGGKAQRTK
jgi:ATP phosphoribosyltransferase regulatory subunit